MSSVTRKPRLRLTINGTVVDGCQSAEVTSRRGAQASSFRLDVVASAVTNQLGLGWIDLDTIQVKIEFGIASGFSSTVQSWMEAVVGTADRVSFDPFGDLATLEGRDLSGLLIDLPLQGAYLNQTSSALAQQLASQCGLSAEVDPTTALVGQYYQIEHSKTTFGAFSRHGSAWDLLSELATIEGFDLWVSGSTLYFKSGLANDSEPLSVVLGTAGAGATPTSSTVSSIVMDRTTGLTGPLQVAVTSWNSRQKKQVLANYPSTIADGARQFVVIKPNLLPDQVEALAKSTYQQVRSHGRVISCSMAGELDLTPRTRISVTGSGTGWDGVYAIDKIERRMSMTLGFVQHVVARIDSD